MAHDFLGNELSIGDDVVFLSYYGTSASLERGIITRVSEHTAEISGGKRRAEYKIIKVNPVAAPQVAEEMLAQQAENIKDWVPVVRCRECIHFDPEGYGGASCAETGAMIWPNEDDYCSRGQRRDQFAGDGNMDGGGADAP